MDKWIVTDKYIIGYDSSILEKSFKKIHLFDLDYTIIKTKSGKRFPTNDWDWEFLTQNIKSTINNLEFCGIVSNQNGLTNEIKTSGWIKKIKEIAKHINIKFVFCSLKTTNYRKPMDGSWKYMKENLLLNTDVNKLIKKQYIYYIGDACGRENDFSDTDLKFALNCNFVFKLPEQFFNFGTKEKCYTSYPELTYYKDKQYKLIIDNLYNKINDHIKNDDNIIIMTIGFPASGKSQMRKTILEKYENFKYINSDDIKNNVNNDKLIKNHKEALKNKTKFFIDDNTNLNYEKREEILKKFANYKKISIVFTYDIDLCLHLDLMRMYWFGYKPISKIVYNTLNKKSPNFQDQDFTEQFNHTIKIDNLLPQYKIKNNLDFFY